MPEVDPVILRLLVDNGKFQAEMRNTARLVESTMGRQERSVQNLEAQFRKSSGAIGASLKGLAGTLGAAFTGRELVGLIDGFTRVQNSLRVAGLEGQELAKVQQQLLELSARYGVSLESLSSLFGNATQAGKELGASQAEIVRLTEATAQSLLITGTSATAASGAILGLQQALASGTVRAEEFNQINEGGLRPLLQAAANAEKYGGSVAKLRQAVIDGKVSSQEFYQAILAGATALESQAAKATLTISGAFESLNSQLTAYVGEAAKANGVSAALAIGIQKLADNLDLAAGALAVIAAVLAGRFAASMVVAGAGLVRTQIAAATTAASFNAMTLQATRASTALTTVGAVGAATGRALLAAFGGPVGLAVTALTLGVGYYVIQANAAKAASEDLKNQLQVSADSLSAAEERARKAGVEVENLGDKSSSATGDVFSIGRAMKFASDAASQLAKNAKFAAAATATLRAVEAERRIAEIDSYGKPNETLSRINAALGGQKSNEVINKAFESLQAERGALQAIAQNARQEAKVILATPDAAFNEKSPAPAPAGDDKKKKKGRAGPTAEEIEARFQSELSNEIQRTIEARRSIAIGAEEQAALERQALAIAVERYKSDVQADKNYSDAQKAALQAQADKTAEIERERININEREALAREQLDVMSGEIANDRDIASAQARLAETRDERARLEFRLLDLAYEQERAELEAVLASETATKAQKDIANARLAILGQLRGMEAEEIGRRYESPLERRRRDVRETAANMGDAIQNIELDAVDRLTDGLADASTEFIKLGGVAGDVLNGIIRDMIRLAAQQAIFGGAGVGGILGTIGGLFGIGGAGAAASGADIVFNPQTAAKYGFASGGYTGDGNPGDVAGFVHKGEYVIPASAVQRIGVANLDALSSARSMTGVSAASPASAMNGTIRVAITMDNDVFTARVQEASVPVAVEVVRQNGPGLIQAAKAETMRDMTRPRL
ncbi:putative phage tape measure protein [Sphingobium sp. SYK-6]|uniref:tape measure protein n=1 Tax=Sphingobium sp. (strain NBRC 103272 / SYK-6) TaxID=627192 RepID=UPI0002277139|nr:tape measure protein [Sphingobium sp. SYK-6]BAK66893.1 putative phage tape measure protein [Sphingobium sp. SYK-6]